MDAILQSVQERKTLAALIGGGILGLLLGLVIGWGLWPVKWTNATPGQLRSDFQSTYVLWVAEQYEISRDLEWAKEKLGAEYWEKGRLAQVLEQLAQERSGPEATRLTALARVLEETAPAPASAEEPATDGGINFSSVIKVCGVGLLVILFIVGVIFLFTRLRESRAAPGMAERVRGVPMVEGLPTAEPVSWGTAGPPLAQFVTTYSLGDDHYDPSFSIEMENGEFVGECGVGISETIGVGEPGKVTALEAWLFDKNDIRTVTKVLMSDYSFHDEALRTKLAPKGEPVLAEEGKNVILETRGLRMQVRIVETKYGTGELPPDSFFDRLTVDLAAWVKPEGEQAGPAAAAQMPVAPPTL
jgi:hypothetical protein